MIEIELKAHVKYRDALINNLKTFSTFQQKVTRKDTYYHLKKDHPAKDGKDHITARIRKEFKETEEGLTQTIYLTYKRKELRTNSTGTSTEVNDEKETVVSDATALEVLFADIGFKPALHKEKIVEDYLCQTPFGQATLELCNVQGLGDFLEIEILSEKDDDSTVENIQKELKNLLNKSGIPESEIEERYYSEMLKEKGLGQL